MHKITKNGTAIKFVKDGDIRAFMMCLRAQGYTGHFDGTRGDFRIAPDSTHLGASISIEKCTPPLPFSSDRWTAWVKPEQRPALPPRRN